MFCMLSVKSIWPNVPFKPSVFILICYLDDLSIDVSGVLNSSDTIILLFLPLDLLIFALLGTLMLGT